MLAGRHVPDDDVRELADLLRAGGFEDVAHKLDHALLMETMVLALTIVDRESILRALDEPPPMRLPSSGRHCSSSTSGGCARGSSSRTELGGLTTDNLRPDELGEERRTT